MAGRDDFGALRSSLLTDERAHRAAEIYTAKGWADGETALGAICGHVVMFGLWAMRDTDDGVLPGSATLVAQQALMVSIPRGSEVVAVLLEVGLLRRVENGTYLVGFTDCYSSILDRRVINRASAKLHREKARQAREELLEEATKKPPKKSSATRHADVSVTSAPRNADVISPPSVGRHADVTPTSGTSGAERAVPAVPAVPQRNGAAGTVDAKSDAPGAAAAALAPGAGASAAAAGVSERNGHDPPPGGFSSPGLPEHMRPGARHPRGLPGETVGDTNRRLAAVETLDRRTRAIVASLLAIRSDTTDARRADADALLAQKAGSLEWIDAASTLINPREINPGVFE